MSTKQQPKEVGAKELAAMAGTDPTELRKWLRSEGLKAEGPRKRYAFTPQRAGQLAKKFKEREADAS